MKAVEVEGGCGTQCLLLSSLLPLPQRVSFHPSSILRFFFHHLLCVLKLETLCVLVSFIFPLRFSALARFYPGFQTSVNGSGASSGALVAAVNLIKTLLNSSSNIKVRKYNKSPQRYWTGASYFIYEQESRFADTRGTGFKPTGSDGNQLEHLM